MDQFKDKNLTNLKKVDYSIFELLQRDNTDIQDELKFGLKVRINTLEENILGIEEGIKSKNSFGLTMHINSVYIHISGILDNLASLIDIRLELKIEKRLEIVLNNKRFKSSLKSNNFKLYSLIQNDFQIWLKTIKEKRDPIAHRKPLFVPPKVINNQKELDKFKEINNNLKNEKDGGNVYSHVIRFQNELLFKPYFVQYDGTKIDNIEETITEDISNLVNLYKKVLHLIEIT